VNPQEVEKLAFVNSITSLSEITPTLPTCSDMTADDKTVDLPPSAPSITGASPPDEDSISRPRLEPSLPPDSPTICNDKEYAERVPGWLEEYTMGTGGDSYEAPPITKEGQAVLDMYDEEVSAVNQRLYLY
jgi:hypothetical protein